MTALDPADVAPIETLAPWTPAEIAALLLVANTQARAWAAMGNTQRFSDPDR
jgi:hypothetical protein